MNKFLNVDGLRELCSEDKDLMEEIKSASKCKHSKALREKINSKLEEIINPELKGKKVSETTINEFRIKLNENHEKSESINILGTSENDESSKIYNIENNNNESNCNIHQQDGDDKKDSKSDKDNTLPADSNGQGQNSGMSIAKDNSLEEPMKENNKKSASNGEGKKEKKKAADESVQAKAEGEKKAVYVDVSKLEAIDSARDKINVLENEIALIKKQFDIFQTRPDGTSEETNEKSLESLIPDLNEILNNSNEKITVTINKELLSKATKFVDAHSLIRLESVIRGGYDLNSTVVQSILLAFIHQNSLL